MVLRLSTVATIAICFIITGCYLGPTPVVDFEVEEAGTAEVEYANGDAEVFICDLCGRHFALMPTE
jgi:hypothetical protein